MKSFLIIILCLFTGLLCGQTEKKVDTKVSAATVFKNRALVTREADISLPGGKHKIIISNLPNDLEDESVRISSDEKSIKILDVEIETKFTTEIQHDKIKRLQDQIDSLNQLINIASDKITVYYSEKEFIESLKAQASKTYSERLLKVNSTADWNAMLKYIETNLSEIYKGIREENRKKYLYEQKINVLNKEISDSRGIKTKNYKEIIVNLENNGSDKIKLFASYLVQNANWYPVYDTRITIEEENAELHYFGMVHQSTGEDWNDISLTLSTAEPMSVKSLPELARWFIDINRGYSNITTVQGGVVSPLSSGSAINYKQNAGLPSGIGVVTGYLFDQQTGEPLIGANAILQGTSLGSATDQNGKFYISNVPAGSYQMLVSYVGFQTKRISLSVMEKKSAEINVPLEAASISTDEIVVTAERPLIQKDMVYAMRSEDAMYTNISNTELSTNFEVPTKSTIPSDNTTHKVTVAITNLPVAFSYTSIPKINPAVYLKGKIANKNDYPLLEGENNIFVDNDFINKTSLRTIVPADTLELALGIDDKIQIKKVLINKFEETKGLLGGSKQISYEYEIQVTNKRKSDENILIYDQVPITMNEDIKVSLIEPNKELKELGNENKLEWDVTLKPGEKKILPLKYQVSFPVGMNVSGLE